MAEMDCGASGLEKGGPLVHGSTGGSRHRVARDTTSRLRPFVRVAPAERPSLNTLKPNELNALRLDLYGSKRLLILRARRGMKRRQNLRPRTNNVELCVRNIPHARTAEVNIRSSFRLALD